MKEFFSQGKVLLTAEYAVLEGVKALALPTKKGQALTVNETNNGTLVWKAFTHDHELWIDAVFNQNFECIDAKHTAAAVINKLTVLLKAMNHLCPAFNKTGLELTTHLDFPQDWGLGSSSTLINNLGQWLQINPYELLEKSFGGSGYDIAAAQSRSPLFYTRNVYSPTVETSTFNPPFKDALFFVHLNQKRNSQDAISSFNKRSNLGEATKERLAKIGKEIEQCTNQKEFNLLLREHEMITGDFLGELPIQERLFADFNGQIKSLGAWGGDFILASGDQQTSSFFEDKGFKTVIAYKDFILQ